MRNFSKGIVKLQYARETQPTTFHINSHVKLLKKGICIEAMPIPVAGIRK